MDLNELEGLLTNVISDRTSTEDCRKRFEAQLGTIEKGGEEWLERRFMRYKNFFRKALMAVIEEGKAGDQMAKIDRLQHLINQVSKDQAFGLVQRSRAQLRKSIPELRQHDQHGKMLRQRLGEDFPEEKIERVTKLVISDQKDGLIAIGETLSDEAQIRYYDAISTLNYRRAAFAIKLAQAARRLQKTELLPAALKKIMAATVFSQEDLVVYSYLARKLNDRYAMESALKKLERYLDFDAELISYALTAKKIGDEEAMHKALGKLGRNLKNPTYLNAFASLARALNHQEHKKTAMEKLEAKLDKPECLTSYAAIARDQNDTEKMQKAMPLLAEQCYDPACVTMYGAIARRLKDPAATQRSLELLEPHVGEDIFCLTTYAKNAIALNDSRRKGHAMTELKKHLDDPICETLYLKIAESGPEQSIMEAPAA